MGRRNRNAFTLVELLVVIGIIGILMSILFPVIARVRRRAIVLASPVAYVGMDQRLHLTDPSGSYDTKFLKVAGEVTSSPNPGYSSCPACHSPPAWSPSGQLIALQADRGALDYAALLDPARDFSYGFPRTMQGRSFISWLGETKLLVADESQYFELDTLTGRTRSLFERRGDFYSLSPAPAGAPGAYIASIRLPNSSGSAICFLGKTLAPRRVVWRDTGSGRQANEWPRADGNGEFVGWTMRGPLTGYHRRIAWKAVGEPPARPPNIIGLDFPEACFCDWTEQGQILANVNIGAEAPSAGSSGSVGTWHLMIFDRDGHALRELPTDMAPNEGVVASWRKYGHQ